MREIDAATITDTVARLAGDEFVIVLEGLHGEDEAQLVAHKIVAGLQRPFDLPGRAIQVSAMISVRPIRERSTDDLPRSSAASLERAAAWAWAVSG